MRKSNVNIIEFFMVIIVLCLVLIGISILVATYKKNNSIIQVEKSDKKEKYVLNLDSRIKYGEIFEITNTENGVTYTIYRYGSSPILLDKAQKTGVK